ncbi:MAG: sigma 54-interacting transcriptional regulator [Negativicutes bacterium]
MSRIVFISPYRDLSILAKSVAAEMNLQIEFYEGWYEEVGDIVKKLQGPPIDILMSRGGNAKYLAANFDIPVIPFNFSPYDLLEGLDEARNFSRNVAITSFGEHLIGLDLMEKAFGLSITEVVFHNLKELKTKISALALSGNYCILGGGPSVVFAQEVGLTGLFLRTNRITMQAAFNTAVQLATLRQEEMHKMRQIETILDAAYEGIIAINATGKIEICNAAAVRIFDLGSSPIIGQDIKSIIPDSNLTHVLKTAEAEIDKIQNTVRGRIITNRIPVKSGSQVIGVVATFQETTRVFQAANKIEKEAAGQHHFHAKANFPDIIGKSAILEVKKKIARNFAESDLTILLYGASGTGKELFAQSIHNVSTRRHGPFVAINCGALPPTLLESELFGYEEGAFTGARRKGKSGLFELARGGSIFLDEIDALPIEMQGRFLRVLQEREILRVGGESIIPINVRVIAATNKRAKDLLQKNLLREDLFYRLNVLWLELPPLSDRREDIPNLCEHFIPPEKKRLMQPMLDDLLPYFQQYSWPGNIRELQNVIQRLSFFIHSFDQYSIHDFLNMVAPTIVAEIKIQNNDDRYMRSRIKNVEQDLILKAVNEHKSLEQAAAHLGIGRSTLVRKLKQIRQIQLPPD